MTKQGPKSNNQESALLLNVVPSSAINYLWKLALAWTWQEYQRHLCWLQSDIHRWHRLPAAGSWWCAL